MRSIVGRAAVSWSSAMLRLLAVCLVAACAGDTGTTPTPPPSPPLGRVYMRFSVDHSLPIHAVDVTTGAIERIVQPERFPIDVRVSPDSRRLAYSGERFQLVVHDLLRSETRDLTTGEWVDHAAAWSPDARSIAIARDGYLGRPSRIMQIAADGSGEREVIALRSTDAVVRMTWSADGQWIYAFMYGRIPSGVYRVRADGTSTDMEYVLGQVSYFEINPRTGQAAILRRIEVDSVDVGLFDERTGTLTLVGRVFTPFTGSCCTTELAWSPDDRYLAVMTFGQPWNHLHVFDVRTRAHVVDRALTGEPLAQGFSWGRDPATVGS